MVTLTFMFGFVFVTFAAIAIASRQERLVPALLLSIGVTVGWAFLVWLISPFIMDLMQRWLYSAKNITLEELRAERPAVAAFVEEVAQRHGIKQPQFKLIDDMTPQAYCYGSHGNNARLVTTRGLMHYLNDEELKAVYGHELGHIVHRDFIVMTMASTLLNVLWTIYVVARNIKGKNNSRPGMPVAIAALVFWWISQYLLLFLSRTREYYADEFSGAETGNPNALSMALVKIAYGLAQLEQTEFSRKLLGGTRAMGITDYKAASTTGLAYRSLNAKASGRAASTAGAAAVAIPADAEVAAPPTRISVTLEGVRRIEKVMLFDLYNPWATVSEIGSTHPLTGKRIRALGEQASAMGQRPMLKLDAVDAFGQAIDKGRMYGTFALEVGIYYAPPIFAGVGILLAIGSAIAGHAGASAGLILSGIGLGLTGRAFYRYGPLGDAPPVTVLELMSDPYASPLKGRPVRLEGTVIGRATAGGKLTEDVVLEDREGGLMALNYESPFGPLGNWWFATRRVKALLEQRVEAVGWFRRGVSQQVDLDKLHVEGGEDVSSFTGFWAKLGGILVLLLGIAVGLAGGLA